MSSVPFHYVDLRAFSYATEDDKRVADALRTFLPEDVEIDRSVAEGHFGDQITTFSARVERADDVRHVLGVFAGIDDVDRVLAELDQRVNDNCALMVRLDKQAAFGGDAALGDGLTLRGKVEAYPAKRKAAVENAREALAGLADEHD